MKLKHLPEELGMRSCSCALFIAVTATALHAQPATIQARPLPAPSVTSPQFVGNVFNILELRTGMLLVNDTKNHRVMLSDSLLRTTTVVIDSSDYGARAASIMRYVGDSVVFVEAITPSARIIDPGGRVIRTMAIPRARDAGWLMPTGSQMAGVDERGRFVHRGAEPRPVLPPLKPGEERKRAFPDSSPIVRDDPVTRMGDTIARARSMHITGVEVAGADGRTIMYMKPVPFELVDEWAMTPSGKVAILRGRDYHIDLIDGDGKVTSLPRIPYRWEALNDSVKAVVVDSVNREQNRPPSDAPSRPITGGAASGGGASGGSTGGGASGGARVGGSPFPPAPKGAQEVNVSDLPDYRPPFGIGALKVTADGYFWIRTNIVNSDSTRLVYDVVDVGGRLVDRLLVPSNRTIAGFDRHGNVFLVAKEEGGVQYIERVHWAR